MANGPQLLHIGTHETGTTSLQTILTSHCEPMALCA